MRADITGYCTCIKNIFSAKHLMLVLPNGIIGFIKSIFRKILYYEGKIKMLLFYLTMLDEDIDKLNFERIYRKYHLDIYKRIRNILPNEEDAKDAMQDTWVKVIDHIEKFREKEDDSTKAYIMRIARNQSISILRMKQKEAKTLCDIDEVEIADDEELFAACESNGVSVVLECFKMLTEIQRDVLNLYYIHHHSLKEIAKLMNLSEVTVAGRWARGRARLIELLEQRGLS